MECNRESKGMRYQTLLQIIRNNNSTKCAWFAVTDVTLSYDRLPRLRLEATI
jgi:hypothetical protein